MVCPTIWLVNSNRMKTLFLIILVSFTFETLGQKNKVDNSREIVDERFFSFTSISEVQFRNGIKNNFNAPFEINMEDSTRIQSALLAIEKTYNEGEIELAQHELCSTPRCLTSFKAFYPSLDLLVFYILDYHFEKACFVTASSSEMASGDRRFRGSYGIMSKDGFWAGLERQGSDNFLQIEICKSFKEGVWSIFSFDIPRMDINVEEKLPMFWVNKNTLFIATKEYPQNISEDVKLSFYSLQFR